MEKKFNRNFDELQNIVAMTQGFCDKHGIDDGKRYIVDLCIEELFVNMVTYDIETDEDILIELSMLGDDVQVTMTDYNVDRFDPRTRGDVDIDAPLEQRTPGGLGLYLVLKMVNSINYGYRNRTSTITFVASGK